ncbi:hypothetical protein ACFWGD_05035 [Corynebacterium sp. NPDC060344]|uniref:hypothetical protein n=1 Tax=Corynebacterium sp. NPDC060344 TaxID=3347101 RepID=UPI0036610FEF
MAAGRVPLIAYTWLACVLVPVAVFVISSGAPIDDTAVMMVMYMWLPSFVLGNGMLAVYLGQVPPRVVRPLRCLLMWVFVLIFHATFILGAVMRIEREIAGLAAKAAFLATVVAYAASMLVVVRAIRAGQAS